VCVSVIIVTEYNRRRDPGWWPTTSRVVTQTRGQPTSSGRRRSVRVPVCCFFFAIPTRHPPPPFHLLCILDKKHFIYSCNWATEYQAAQTQAFRPRTRMAHPFFFSFLYL
jgi:hypothetical protein